MQQQQQQQQQQQSSNSVSSVIIPPALPLALQTLINGGVSTTRHRSHHHSTDRAAGKVDDWAQVQEHIHTRVAQVVQRGRDLLNVSVLKRFTYFFLFFHLFIITDDYHFLQI